MLKFVDMSYFKKYVHGGYHPGGAGFGTPFTAHLGNPAGLTAAANAANNFVGPTIPNWMNNLPSSTGYAVGPNAPGLNYNTPAGQSSFNYRFPMAPYASNTAATPPATTGGTGYDSRADIVAGAGSALGGLAGLIGTGKKARGEQQGRADKASEDIKAFYDKAAGGGYDVTLDPAYSRLYEMARLKTSTDPVTRAAGTGLTALSQGGERSLLAGLNPLMRDMAAGETQIGLSDLQREMAGLDKLAGARSAVTRENELFRRGLGMEQLAENKAAKARALDNIEAMKRARQDAFGQLAGGAGRALTAGFMGQDGGVVPQQFFNQGGVVGGFGAALGERALDSIAYTDKGFERRMKKAEQMAKINEVASGGSGNNAGGSGDVTITVSKDGKKQTMENGGIMKYQAGGNVLAQILGGAQGGMPTPGGMPMEGGQPPVQGPFPGEPSHETNPIHMITDDGEKVGEAMGGEFMINDKQAEVIMDDYSTIAKAIEDGREPSKDELMALYQSVDKVFGQPQFQQGEEEMEGEEGMEEEGMEEEDMMGGGPGPGFNPRMLGMNMV